jgi:hypothetical protein
MFASSSPIGCDVAASEIRARIAHLSAARAANSVFELEQRGVELGTALRTGNSHNTLNDTLTAAGTPIGCASN